MDELYIAGASSRAQTTREYLETLYPDIKVRAYLVSPEMDDNPKEIDGIPVFAISEDSKINTGNRVYLGTRGVNHEKITGELVKVGFVPENIIPVTPTLDIELRNKYVRKIFDVKGKRFEKLSTQERGMNDREDLISHESCIYIAKAVFDNDFSENVPLKEFESIIQAGTAVSERHLSEAEYFDDDGENISSRNKQFCELTALYWIWKNAEQDIIGLEHWRRRFLLPADWIERMKSEKIDLILPVPLCVMPSLEDNYRSRHVEKVWDMALTILKDIHPEDSETVDGYFRENNLYSPCNMIIARRDVLKEYCSWLFPVLLKLNDEIGILEDSYQNRYPGFISERLLNYYFDVRQKALHRVYADKSFLN